MNPRTSRTLLVVVALGAVVIATLSAYVGDPPVVTVTYAYSTDAAGLLEPLIAEFNNSKVESGGSTVKVQPSVVGGLASGKTRDLIKQGSLKPVAWTPASSMWGQLLDAESDSSLVPERNPSLVQSPLLVAMFNSTNDRLKLDGLEPKNLRDVLALSTDNKIRLAHTDPELSTSGLFAVLSEFYLAAGRDGATLTEGDVDAARAAVGTYERSIDHYVDIAKDFIPQWCRYRQEFADAAYMQETTYLELQHNPDCPGQFMAIYPDDVPLAADYPYMVLDASWVDSKEREAADVFGRWLENRLSTGGCQDVRREGFRKGGCVPSGVKYPLPEPLAAPQPNVLRSVQRLGGELRRSANVMVVLDGSSAMLANGRFDRAQQALTSGEGSQSGFVDCPRPHDRVGLRVFGHQRETNTDVPVSLELYLDPHKKSLTQTIDRLIPENGDAKLLEAVYQAVTSPQLQSPETINTVVVLSFGVDRGSDVSVEQLVAEFRRNQRPVQIIAVSYGDGDESKLKAVVGASFGRYYEGDRTDVASVSQFLCRFL
jgi:Ca-activated chloride channel family protein